MATLLDASAVAATGYLAPAASSAAPSSRGCVVGLGVRGLPVRLGLRIGSSTRKLSSSAVSSRGESSRSRGRGIVCEAQETVTGGE